MRDWIPDFLDSEFMEPYQPLLNIMDLPDAVKMTYFPMENTNTEIENSKSNVKNDILKGKVMQFFTCAKG